MVSVLVTLSEVGLVFSCVGYMCEVAGVSCWLVTFMSGWVCSCVVTCNAVLLCFMCWLHV